jgi:lipoprotein-anchoring transpeptidase ErfK/SrfK
LCFDVSHDTFEGEDNVRSTRVTVRLVAATAATVIGGGLGVATLAPAAAGAAPIATVPATAAAVSGRPAAAPASAAAGSCSTGKYHKAVEANLKKLGGFGKVTVDGKQSAADCAAIKKFQKRYGIQPAAGLAGPTTNDVAKRLATTNTKDCKAKRTGTTICISLTRQTVWVMRKGKVLVKPTVTRTGMKGHRTPTGTFKISQHVKREYSEKYKVWMPYWQRFSGGNGLHQTTTYLHDMWRGSHGCVNLLAADAKQLYGIGKVGTTVKVFGRRPGT